MTDPFGNYLFTKLIEYCELSQKESAIQQIIPELLSVAVDMYGTQSLQKIMPYLEPSQIMAIINTLKNNTISLVKHSKANYLIQYFLDHLSPEYTKWIFDAVADQIEDVSRDRVGCVIVKKCIDHSSLNESNFNQNGQNNNQNNGNNNNNGSNNSNGNNNNNNNNNGQLANRNTRKHKLVSEIVARALTLVQDPFGNYVVQHILNKVPEQADNLISTLLGHLTDLCVQKFSSNVVEKRLQVASPEIRKRMLHEITTSEVLPQLLNDRFANFVIQTALDVAESEQHKELVQKILPHLGKHYSPYSKHLQKKILKV